MFVLAEARVAEPVSQPTPDGQVTSQASANSLPSLVNPGIPLEIHFKNIDNDAAKPRREKKSIWDIISTLFTIASGIAVFVFGTLINGKLEEKAKERQLHSENVRQMQTLLLDLENPDTKRETAEASALALAAYGRDAVPMLLHTLGESTSFAGEAAANALRAIEPEEGAGICPGLIRILDNRTGLYSFAAHGRALEVMADVDCHAQVPQLQDYQRRLDAAISSSTQAEYPFSAIGGGPPSPENVNSVKTQLDKTLHILQGETP